MSAQLNIKHPEYENNRFSPNPAFLPLETLCSDSLFICCLLSSFRIPQVRTLIKALNTALIVSLLLPLELVHQSLRSAGLSPLLVPSGDSLRQRAFPTTFPAPPACILSCLMLSRLPGLRQTVRRGVRAASPNFGRGAPSLFEFPHLEWPAIFFGDGPSFCVLSLVSALYLH